MTQNKFIRIKLTTWKKLRKMFPGLRNESATSYIDRVVEKLDSELIVEWLNEKKFKIE